MGPISYAIDVQSPFQAVLNGYRGGAAIRSDIQQQEQAQLAQQQAIAQREQQSRVLSSLISNKNASFDDYANATLAVPGMKEQLEQALKMKNAGQQQSFLRDAGQVMSAVQSNRPDLAIQMLNGRAEALESGGGDKREAEVLRAQAKAIGIHPESARAIAGMMLSQAPGGKEVLANLSAFGVEQRAADEAPADLATKNANAVTARANAGIKTAEAGVAKQKVEQEVLKLADERGLTRAQTNQALAQTSKLGAEVQKMAIDAEGAGGLDPEKRFDFESKLRKEYATQTTGYQEVKESFGRIKAADNTGPGDIALIYGYMKMLDPGSVVREGEFATASNSAGVPAAILNIYNKVINGERLTPGQRKTFTGQAERLFKSAETREKEVRGGVEQVVKSYKLNPDNVFYSTAPETTTGAPAAGGLPPALANRGWAKY